MGSQTALMLDGVIYKRVIMSHLWSIMDAYGLIGVGHDWIDGSIEGVMNELVIGQMLSI